MILRLDISVSVVNRDYFFAVFHEKSPFWFLRIMVNMLCVKLSLLEILCEVMRKV